MSKKTIYLIRHGETLSNRKHIHQGLDVPLSPRGEKQALSVAERLKSLEIDALISSNVLRAKQTAEHISTQIDKDIEFEDLFQEIIRPPELVGKSVFDPLSIFVLLKIYLNASNPSWHYSIEENILEFRNRANRGIKFLEDFNAENIVVVSHRVFIGAILAEIMCNKGCSIATFTRESIRLGRISNTGVTTLTFDLDRKNPWNIESMNDTSHLSSVR